MNTRRVIPEMLLLLAVAFLLAPGIASLNRTPYGLSLPHVWFAIFYVGVAAWAVLALCVRVLAASNAPSQGSVRSGVLVVLLAIAFILALLLPFGALIAAYHLFGAFRGGPDWVLFNKYVGHFVLRASSGYLWVISLCLAICSVGLIAASSKSLRLRHEV